MNMQEQYEEILEVRDMGVTDLFSDARERGVADAVHDFVEAKTGGFRRAVIGFYILSYVTHPVAWTGFMVSIALRQDGFSYGLWLACVIGFGIMYYMHNDVNDKLYLVRDVLPMTEDTVEFVRFGLGEGKEIEPDYDDLFEGAVDTLAAGLREEDVEIWHVDGNKIVCERGCFVGYPAGETPDDKQVTHVY